MGFVLSKISSYQAESVAELVLARQWEVTFLGGFFGVLTWFIAEYTGCRPRWLPGALSLIWVILVAANWLLPWGLHFADEPVLSHFRLPWGESVVDLRPHRASAVYVIGWGAILAQFGYAFYAARAQYARGQRRRALALSAAMGGFLAILLFALAVNLDLVEFVPIGEFGFLGLLLLMDIELLLQSRAEKRQMRDILDALPAAISLHDAQGRFLLTNRQYRTIFAPDATEIVGKTDFEVHPQPLAGHLHAARQPALENGRMLEVEDVFDLAGREFRFETRHIPLRSSDGMVRGVCSVHLDVTEARRTDAALAKLRRQVWHSDRVASTGAIAGSLAHEICQPLAAILNNAQAGLRFLARPDIDLGELRDLLQDIVRDDKRAGAVINGLRAMLQQQDLAQEDVDLGRCVAEVFDLLHTEFVRNGVEAMHELEAGLNVRGNRTQLQQVVLNLLVNAVEAMQDVPPDGRTLRVTASRAGERAIVSLRDSGVGIPPELMDRVFEGFYTTKPTGLGVGLEVCRSILESHRGTIEVEPNTDRGVTFRFSLPLLPPSEAGA